MSEPSDETLEGLNEAVDDLADQTVDISAMAPAMDLDQLPVAAYLIVLTGSRVGEMVRLTDRLVIGRGGAAGLRIAESSVSKEHVELKIGEDGSVIANDLESRNGTFINGEQVRSHVLNDGDKIRLGATTILKFSFADSLEQSFQQQLYHAAIRDSLTGLYNRRRLDEQLVAEYSYAVRHHAPLSIVLLDIDHFKQLNDTHGHVAGDNALRGLADCLNALIRREDFAARYGGEEFMVVCRGTDPTMALRVAERIRETVEAASLVEELPDVRVTISAGIAGIPSEGISDVKTMVEAADGCLYKAKEGGRNRTCLFADTTKRV